MDSAKQYHFVTGRLAEKAVRRIVEEVGQRMGFRYTIQIMPITVAALMTTDWIASRLEIPVATDIVMLPGYVNGDVNELRQRFTADIVLGPKDLRELPTTFGDKDYTNSYGDHTIEIVAEINHAPRQSIDETVRLAQQLSRDGADIIDVGCDPGSVWQQVGTCVRALRDEGLRVSVDSLQIAEIELAVRAGAELVLSVNGDNRHAAVDWDAEVVAIPQTPDDLDSLDETIEFLQKHQCRFRVDPILEPIGFGFVRSLERYAAVRRRYPDLKMLMGIGNLTELTECDSAGINVMLLSICEELKIDQVLTTQVIPWAQSSVKECDIGRQLAHYAVSQETPPKHVDSRLVMLRDPRRESYGSEFLQDLAAKIKDPNFRLFAEDNEIHVMAAGIHETDIDPFELFEKLCRSGVQGEPPRNLNLSHAFYLGFEMSKALTALTLGKQYTQDQALRWGHLTREEKSHRDK
jgi:dihydropteroate synthase